MISKHNSLASALLALAIAGSALAGEGERSDCAAPGEWRDPTSEERLDPQQLFAALARRDVVLLGESHTDAEHHRWQTYTLAGLRALQPRMVMGLEMFPRRVQSVLDDWSAGRLGSDEFLRRSEWSTVWAYPAELYLPLLHFARQNRLPLVALNVERELVSLVGERGWAAVPPARREGVSDPAPATPAYRRALAHVYLEKQRHGGESALPTLDEVLADDAFDRFVEAQLTWDRAMAQALANAHRAYPRALVVGIAGRGHLEHGYGIPHQLADLGVDDVAVLLPVAVANACAALSADLATAVFVLDDQVDETGEPPPRLGVRIGATDGGVRIEEVVGGSVADQSGLARGDLVREAAGVVIDTTGGLIEIVQRQAPGTWLPLEIERAGRRIEVIARFPPRRVAQPGADAEADTAP